MLGTFNPLHRFALRLIALGSLGAWGVASASAELLPITTRHPNIPASQSASAASGSPSWSGDGRWVAFLSAADDLVTNCHNGLILDVFVYDLATKSVKLVSVTPDGRNGGNGDSSHASISADGRYIAFLSAAADLTENDTNGWDDVFVRDLVTGTTIRASLNDAGEDSAGDAFNPTLTSDGNKVFFESAAPNLVPGDTNGQVDLFLRAIPAAKTVLVSVAADGGIPLGGPSTSATPSDDGAVVAFLSTATNLVSGTSSRFREVYVRDFARAHTVRVHFNDPTNRYTAHYHALSSEGRFLVVAASAQATRQKLHWIDLEEGANALAGPSLAVASNLVSHPSTSRDGQTIAFAVAPNSSVSNRSVYVWSSISGLRSVQAPSGPELPVPAYAPMLSPDGSRLAFLSEATNLVAGTLEPAPRLYVQELSSGGVTSAVLDAGGVPIADPRPLAVAFSSSGRYLVFESDSGRVVEHDRNGTPDVFLADLESPATALISRRHADLHSEMAAGWSWTGPNSLSADGRFVVWTSTADDLVPGDTNRFADVFVKDLVTGQVELVSVNQMGAASGDAASTEARISGNGRFVTFISKAGNLVANDANRVEDVFWRDLQMKTTVVLSLNLAGTATANKRSGQPSISADGQRIAFHTQATDLSTNFPGGSQVIIHDRRAGSNWGVASGQLATANPVLSEDGSTVAFFGGAIAYLLNLEGKEMVRALTNATAISLSSNGERLLGQRGSGNAARVYWRDASGDVRLLAGSTAASFEPRLSGDGRFALFTSHGTEFALGDLNQTNDVFLDELSTGTTQLVSVRPDGAASANGPSRSLDVSADGGAVLFSSAAENLVHDDTNGLTDVFFRDLHMGTTRLVTESSLFGDGANEPSRFGILGASGRTAVVVSFASNLAAGDLNHATDLFLWRSPPPPEIVLTVLWDASNARVILRYSVEDGSDYYVEFRNGLSAAEGWQILEGGPHNSGAIRVDAGSEQRYFRVRSEPR